MHTTEVEGTGRGQQKYYTPETQTWDFISIGTFHINWRVPYVGLDLEVEVLTRKEKLGLEH